jgi:hypothetical protein
MGAWVAIKVRLSEKHRPPGGSGRVPSGRQAACLLEALHSALPSGHLRAVWCCAWRFGRSHIGGERAALTRMARCLKEQRPRRIPKWCNSWRDESQALTSFGGCDGPSLAPAWLETRSRARMETQILPGRGVVRSVALGVLALAGHCWAASGVFWANAPRHFLATLGNLAELWGKPRRAKARRGRWMRKVLTTTMEPDAPEHHSATATRGAKTGRASMLVGWLHGRRPGHTEQSRIGLPVRNLDHLVT